MKIGDKELMCDKCGVPCGGVNEPGLYRHGERWLCKDHYDGLIGYLAAEERKRLRYQQDIYD